MSKFIFDLDMTLYYFDNIANLKQLYKRCKPNLYLQELLKSIPDKKYIITNANLSHTNLILKKLGILDYFEDILAVDHFQNMKPHPEPYELAIQRFNLNKNENIIFFEDNILNLETAKNAFGWTTVLVNPLFNTTNRPEYIDFNFSNIENALMFFKIKDYFNANLCF